MRMWWMGECDALKASRHNSKIRILYCSVVANETETHTDLQQKETLLLPL